jgi:hypothetical protein
MSLTTTTPFLRQILLMDAAVSAATGLAMAALAPALSGLLDLPSPLLVGAGLVLLPYAASLVFLGTRDLLPRWTVWSVVALNAAWAADCLLLLTTGWVEPNALGMAFVILQAAAVAIFAELQILALRRAPALNPSYA